MYVDAQIRVGDTYVRAFASLLAEVVGNGVLCSVSHKLRVAELLGEDHCIDKKRVVLVHIVRPFHLLHYFVNFVGVGSLELFDWFKHFHCCAQTEVCFVKHLLSASERHHAASYLYVVCTKIDEFLGKHLFQTLEGLCYNLKFFHL